MLANSRACQAVESRSGEFPFSPLRVSLTWISANDHQPSPPAWLTSGLNDLLTPYPNDRFEGVMRYTAVNSATDLPCAAPPPGTTPEGVKWMYLPRIRCHDCPGKLYTPGPETTVGNFEVHLKNRQHREKVDARIAAERNANRANGS